LNFNLEMESHTARAVGVCGVRRRRSLPLSCRPPAVGTHYDSRVPGARRRWELQLIHMLAKENNIRKPRRRSSRKKYYNRVSSLPAALPYLRAGYLFLPWTAHHLHQMVVEGNYYTVLSLLEAEHIDVNETVDGDTALMTAVRVGDSVLTEMLIGRGAKSLVDLRQLAEECGTYDQLWHVLP
jgi:hypothetical protein